MKKIKYIVLILAAAISTAACNKEITDIDEVEPAQVYEGGLTVSAVAGTVGNGYAGTKAHGDYGYDILWDENDKIAVKDATGHQGTFGITDGVGEKVGTFAQSVDDKYVYSGTVTGYYPAEMLQEDGSIKWPTAQKYSKELTGVPMTATATIAEDGTVFNFDGLGGVLQLILTVPGGNLPMKSITVSADNLDNPVSLDCTGLTLGAAAKTVNISLPAQEYTNMKLSFVASNGTQKDLTAKQSITIKKNVVLKGAYALDGFELKTEADYLYFTAVDGSVSIGMQCYGTVETIGFEYTTDPASGTWNNFTANNSVSGVQNMITLKAGETVFIRAKAYRESQSLNKSDSDYWNFVFSGDTNGRVQAGGNIMSLLDPEVKSTTVGSYAFCHLFDAMTYYSNSKLLTSPKILVTKLAPHCFDRMFDYCRTLQEPPMLLPAMELAENCYEYMFSGCSALKYAPALPATKLATECYYGMFNRCTSLKESPYLPASTLADRCYQNMFDGCSSLSSVNVNFTNFNGATASWLSGVSSKGFFYSPQDVAPELLGSSSAVPAGWTAYRNILPDNAAIGTEVYSSGRLGIYVGTSNGHKLLFAKTDVGSDSEYIPGTRFSREELASQSWGQGWRLPTEAEMLALYNNFTLDKFEDAAWFSFNTTSTSLLFPYTNDVSEGRRESRCWLSGGERFFWFRSDYKCGSTAVSEVASQQFSVRLVKEL